MFRSFTFRKVSAKICNFRVPIYKGVPIPWMKWNPSLNDDCWPTIRVKRFTFWKVSVKIWNFRVPVYKGVPLPWMERNPSLKDDCWPTILVWKDSLSEKWVQKYTTLGFPFIKGFPSHERNETHPLTMRASQVYDCEKFHFQKSGC